MAMFGTTFCPATATSTLVLPCKVGETTYNNGNQYLSSKVMPWSWALNKLKALNQYRQLLWGNWCTVPSLFKVFNTIEGAEL